MNGGSVRSLHVHRETAVKARSWKRVSVRVLALAFAISTLVLAGCNRKPRNPFTEATPTPFPEASTTPPATPTPKKRTGWLDFAKRTPKPPSPPPKPDRIWETFDGERAFEHVQRQVEIGPRPSGSKALEKTRAYITAELEKVGWEVERQTFSDKTPRGDIEFTNLVARFKAANPSKPAPTGTQRVIVASHYDTKHYSTIEFVGAHDGASSTGALLELARVLAQDWELALQVELVFFDGEEAVVQFNETDGLYGSRYYAAQLRNSGRAKQFQYGILWDMIGDRDLTITLSPDSPPELAKGIFEASEKLHLREHFEYFNRDIWDDHVWLNRIGIPTIDLIDFDYLYWHTADDTLDKLSPQSLKKVGEVTLFYMDSRRNGG